MKKTVLVSFLGNAAENRKKNLLKKLENTYNPENIISCKNNYLIDFVLFVPKLVYFVFSGKMKKIDFIYVGYLGHFLVPAIKIFSKKPIIFDAYLSIYAMLCIDRKMVKENTILSKLIYYIEKWACSLASVILLDTAEHAKRFIDLYGIDEKKVKVLYIGTDEENFYKINDLQEKKDNYFRIVFCGHYIPLHGVEYIIKAANLLKSKENIKFTLIGNGQTFKENYELYKKLKTNNIEFVDFEISRKELNIYYNNADLVLGIFGEGEKSKIVIPNKIYDAVATQSAVLSLETPAIKELFNHKENILLVKTNNPVDIADSIMEIYNDQVLRERISINAYNLFTDRLNSNVIGNDFQNVIEYVLKTTFGRYGQ